MLFLPVPSHSWNFISLIVIKILQKLIFDHGKYSLFTENKLYTSLAWKEI